MIAVHSLTSLDAVRAAGDRFSAAHAIRALATHNAVALRDTYTVDQAWSVVAEAERQAQQLERGYVVDDASEYIPDSESEAGPWREWLREWGYGSADVDEPEEYFGDDPDREDFCRGT